MRAAQCILGPDSLTMVSKLTHTKTETPIPGVCVLENQIVCKCGSTPTKPCACRTDIKSDSRQRIIEEVMGKYTDVTPIEKVMDEKCRADFIGENQKRHVNFNSKIKDVFQLNVSEIMSSYSFRHSSSYFIEDVTHEKKQFYDSCKHQNDNGHYKEHKKKILPTLHCSKKVFNQISKEKTDVLLSSPLLNYNNFINKTVDCECLDSSGQFTRTNDKPNIFVKSGNYTIEKDSQIQDYGGFILQRCDGISVKTLIKNFLLQVSNKRFNARRSNIFQWVTVESLLNEICTLTRTNDKTGYATENEIEINNMTLNEDDARLSNKNVDQNILLNSQNQCSAVNGQIKTTINYVYVNTKHLKTGVEQCDKTICASIWEEAKSLDSDQINIGLDTHGKSKILKRIIPDQDNGSLKTNDNLHQRKCLRQKKVARSEKSGRSSVKLEETKIKTVDSKASFGKLNKRKIRSDSENFRNGLTNITETPSGTVAMELDEDIIKQIEKQLEVNRKVYASIITTDSGRHIVNFNPAGYSSNNIYVFKKSSSGSLLIEIGKNYVKNDDTITEESSLNSSGSGISVAVAVKLEHPEQDGIKQSQINLDINVIDPNKIPKHVCCSESKLEDMHKNDKEDNFSKLNTPRHARENTKPVFFKLLIKDSNQDLDCPLAVLQVTNSNNYIVDVDKEYEKAYKKTMKEHFGLDFECPIEISKTSSGTVVIDFIDNKDINSAMPNALLTRSLSGSIKIQTNLKRDSDKPSYRTSFSFEGKRPSEVFSSMLNRLPVSKKESKKVPYLTDKKSSSDSNLLQKIRMKLQKQQNLLIESSAFLKRTTSGQYAVVLNKDSKKAFLNDLKSYVSRNVHGKVPIKRMEDGEIIIVLNNDIDENSKNGSLKITPSGNIYVLVDEIYLNKVTNVNENSNCISEAVIPKLEAGTSQKLENKTVTTTCNAVPSSCNSCDPKKCVCGEVLSHSVDNSRSEYFDAKCVTNFKFCSVEDRYHDCKKAKCHYKVTNKYSKIFTKLNVPKENSPHIVIKQCTCHSNAQSGSMGTDQQLFYVSQSICPFHKDRYEAVSNELLEITGLCNKPQKETVKCKDCDDNCDIESSDGKSSCISSDLDHLKFLPPQLPPFLTGFRCE
ncbi:unnamed protein product [Diatraea saccharalis]|uniref:Uncharacterized protein n=1 Tax=Diatraea saccharalis TaxID=40085 RepID=A0A9N9R1L2_9NEOP|nr:unnamed protein product [Diatraea saccharalis]